MNAAIALKQAKAYTDLAQLGLTSITVNGTDIILTRTDGSTAIVSVPVPEAVSIKEIELNVNKEIVITLTDGTTKNLGTIPTVKGDKGDKGDDGYSPTITENENNTDDIYKLDITNSDGTFTTPNLKGKDGDGSVDLSSYAKTDDVNNALELKADKTELFSGSYNDLTDKPTIPSTDGLATTEYVDNAVSNVTVDTSNLVTDKELTNTLSNYTKTEDLPEEYDDTDLSNRVKSVEDDYLKSTDKTELTAAIATAKSEVIETILGEAVDEDFDTLKEVANWIQSDTTNSAELVARVTNVETNLDGHAVKSDVPSDAVFTDTTDLTSMTGTLPIAKGGTGATTVANARDALDVAQKNHAYYTSAYGAATPSLYGHVRISDDALTTPNSNYGADASYAASLYAAQKIYARVIDLENEIAGYTLVGTVNFTISLSTNTISTSITVVNENGTLPFTKYGGGSATPAYLKPTQNVTYQCKFKRAHTAYRPSLMMSNVAPTSSNQTSGLGNQFLSYDVMVVPTGELADVDYEAVSFTTSMFYFAYSSDTQAGYQGRGGTLYLYTENE